MTERPTRKKGTRIDAPHSVNRPRRDATGRHGERGKEAARSGLAAEARTEALSPPAEVDSIRQVDAAHPTEPATRPGAADEVLATSLAGQLDRQAAQLGEALDQRAQQLDRREAQLNARAAELEQALRTARLWAQERERELHDRQAELDARQQRVEKREQALTEEDERLQRQAAELRCRMAELERLDEQLARREAACRASMAELEKQRVQWQNALQHERQKIDLRRTASLQLVRLLMRGVERRRATIEHWAARLAAAPANGTAAGDPSHQLQIEQQLQDRECRLGEQETQLAVALEQLATQRQQLQAQREAFERQRSDWWQHQRAEQRKMRAALRQRRQRLRWQREQLDRREAALLRLREDLAQTHRQTLELRLVAEELWARLVETVPPPRLIRSLGELRERLNDQLRFATESLSEKQRELESLRQQLEAAVHDFQQQQQILQQWFARRQKELGEQTIQIDAQRRRLAEQQNRLEQERQTWQQDRVRLEAELLRLKSQHRLRRVFDTDAAGALPD